MLKKFRKEKKSKEDKDKDKEKDNVGKDELPVKTKKKIFFGIFSRKNKDKKRKRASDQEISGKDFQVCKLCNHGNRPDDSQRNHLSTPECIEGLKQKPSSPLHRSQPLLEKVEKLAPPPEFHGSASLDGSQSSGFHEVHPSCDPTGTTGTRTGTRPERRLSLPSVMYSHQDPQHGAASGNCGAPEPPTDPRILLLHPPVSIATGNGCHGDESQSDDVQSCESGGYRYQDGINRPEQDTKVGQLWIGLDHPVTFADGTTKIVSWTLGPDQIIGRISEGGGVETDAQPPQTPFISNPVPVSVEVERVHQTLDTDHRQNGILISDEDLVCQGSHLENCRQGQSFVDGFVENVHRLEDWRDLRGSSEISGDLDGIGSLEKENLSPKVDSSGRLGLETRAEINLEIHAVENQTVVSPSDVVSTGIKFQFAPCPKLFESRANSKESPVVSEEEMFSRGSASIFPTGCSFSEFPSSLPTPQQSHVITKNGQRSFSDVIWVDASDADNRTTSRKTSGTGNADRLSHNAPSSNLHSAAIWRSVSDVSKFGSRSNLSENLAVVQPTVTDPEYASLLAKKFQAINSRFRTLAADAEARKEVHRIGMQPKDPRMMVKRCKSNDAILEGDLGHDHDLPGRSSDPSRPYLDLTFTRDLSLPDGDVNKPKSTRIEVLQTPKSAETRKFRSVRDLDHQFSNEDLTSFRSSTSSSSIFHDNRSTCHVLPEAGDALRLADSGLNRPGKKTMEQQLAEIRQHFDQWHRDITLNSNSSSNNNLWLRSISMDPTICGRRSQHKLHKISTLSEI